MKKLKPKFSYLALFFLVLSIGCLLAARVIEPTVDAEGVLHEPFPLIPIAYGFFFLGIFVEISSKVKSKFSKKS